MTKERKTDNQRIAELQRAVDQGLMANLPVGLPAKAADEQANEAGSQGNGS